MSVKVWSAENTVEKKDSDSYASLASFLDLSQWNFGGSVAKSRTVEAPSVDVVGRKACICEPIFIWYADQPAKLQLMDPNLFAVGLTAYFSSELYCLKLFFDWSQKQKQLPNCERGLWNIWAICVKPTWQMDGTLSPLISETFQ